MQLDNTEDIIYIERFNNNLTKVYYLDQHYEIYNLTIRQFLKQINHNKNLLRLYEGKYHSPICIGGTLFSPTKNIKDADCEYFNLLKVEERIPYYEHILENKHLLKKAKVRFLEYKKNELFEDNI